MAYAIQRIHANVEHFLVYCRRSAEGCVGVHTKETGQKSRRFEKWKVVMMGERGCRIIRRKEKGGKY